MSGATISRELFNVVNRISALEKGKRYMIILDVPEAGEMNWTVTDLGKVEKSSRGRAHENVEVRVKP